LDSGNSFKKRLIVVSHDWMLLLHKAEHFTHPHVVPNMFDLYETK